jgi:hypothetical protein
LLKAFESRLEWPTTRLVNIPRSVVQVLTQPIHHFSLIDALDFVQAKRKQSSSGVLLGDDVVALEVVPHIDHSLIIALVIVYGLIQRRM